MYTVESRVSHALLLTQSHPEDRVKLRRWPDLHRMWRQYHGSPVTQAGIERAFSLAGRSHGDLAKRTKEETIGARLIVAKNGHLPVAPSEL